MKVPYIQHKDSFNLIAFIGYWSHESVSYLYRL